MIVDLLYCYSSNKMATKGKYQLVEEERNDELLSIYEQDIIELAPLLDADHVVRLGSMLYGMESLQFTNLMWRVEARACDLLDQMDSFHLSSLLRTFSRVEKGKMFGKKSTFAKFEPTVIS